MAMQQPAISISSNEESVELYHHSNITSVDNIISSRNATETIFVESHGFTKDRRNSFSDKDKGQIGDPQVNMESQTSQEYPLEITCNETSPASVNTLERNLETNHGLHSNGVESTEVDDSSLERSSIKSSSESTKPSYLEGNRI